MTRYRFIHVEEANHKVVALCRVMKVSCSGYYDWRAERASRPAQRHAAFDAEVNAAFEESERRYGSRRIHRELIERDVPCSRARVVASMRRQGLRARGRRRYTATTDSKHGLPVAENVLNRDFAPEGPNEAWAGDITYVWTAEGWMYLAVLIDLWSRRIVGYATSKRIDRHLVLDALAITRGLRGSAPGLVHHTTR